MPGFTGFSPETFTFLAGLVHNNERPWFEAHKKDYEQVVVAPALALIAEMDPLLKAISPHYRGVAKKIGGSLMRIYRDTRFGNDKTPYKTNIGIQFRHENAKDVHAPGWYFHVDLEECFVGAGTWHPEPADLIRIRRRIADHPDEYRRALEVAGSQGRLTAAGDSLQKSPKGFDPAHPLAADIRRKDFFVSTTLAPEEVLRDDLVPSLKAKFQASAPYMKFLCQALDAPF